MEAWFFRKLVNCHTASFQGALVIHFVIIDWIGNPELVDRDGGENIRFLSWSYRKDPSRFADFQFGRFNLNDRVRLSDFDDLTTNCVDFFVLVYLVDTNPVSKLYAAGNLMRHRRRILLQ